jgi:hypothetical protein
MALVTAYGDGSHHCKPESWGPDGGGALVDVGCYNAAGQRADSRFDQLFLTH